MLDYYIQKQRKLKVIESNHKYLDKKSMNDQLSMHTKHKSAYRKEETTTRVWICRREEAAACWSFVLQGRKNGLSFASLGEDSFILWFRAS